MEFSAFLSAFITAAVRVRVLPIRLMPQNLTFKAAAVSTEARLARPVDIPNWPAEPKPWAKAGPRGRVCTCTLEGLSFVPLHWATRGGAHGRIRTDTLRVLSALSLRWTTWAILSGELR